ncbi:phosphoribosyl-AMP cyclohydrolase [Altererythrobacter sp. RZ02]|uniref:Phosphoribosyl-AMP cyclohydrolase n=1 Tax=Pontixanthobacter rizhaonensis TaxID=2730337 RepID=A0A848QL00_9SPHN|nr:phosphoribosyl-AMP cyclohydrolase [Pontixanthobacter rizhaonensis]NMW30865.1 phosphoribosyl-AMP cyclohydrolase [Pontixanthobacter rizhaonensis]
MKLKHLVLAAAAPLALAACGTPSDAEGTTDVATAEAGAPITAEEVAAAQTAWGEGIVAIGKVFTEEGDVKAAAEKHIADFYAYEGGDTVLFKPTLAAEDQFRGDADEALSYFIGTEGTEDKGFAIKPWTAVRWENEGTVTDGDSAMAMGNYYFTDTDGNDTKVEYTFGYVRAEDGSLKINLHHSSVPFSS